MVKLPSPSQEHWDDMETWSFERLKRLQFRKVKRLLRFAYDHLPFYRRRFEKAGVYPDHIHHLEDLRKVPTFRKVDVINTMRNLGNFAVGIEAESFGERSVLTTSTGIQGTTFLVGSQAWCWRVGLRSTLRGYWWAGMRPGMRVIMTPMSWHAHALHETRFCERLGVTSIVPWGTLLPRFAGDYILVLTGFHPQFVSMFLPMLFAILTECRRQGLRPRQVFQSVQYMLITGAPLTPQSREEIRRELGLRDLFDGAGNAEGLVASECSFHCGHHLFMDRCYVEIVDPNTGESLPSGRRGALVQTILYPYGSVHIRYDTEDIGEFLTQPCPCGRTWPLMRIYGRRSDLFKVAGKELLPYDVRLCLDEIPKLLGIPYAVIRPRETMPYLRLAIQKPYDGETEALSARIKALVREKLGIEAGVEWTEEMPARWRGITIIEEKDWGAPNV